MKKVLVINPEVGVDVRNRLSKKFGPDFSLSYVQDYAGDDAKDHILSSIIESEFLVLVVIPDASNEPQEWIIKEANRLGKRIIIVFLVQEEIPVPEIVSDYADATVNIESASFGKVIGGGDVFEDPDMEPAASKTRPRSQC